MLRNHAVLLKAGRCEVINSNGPSIVVRRLALIEILSQLEMCTYDMTACALILSNMPTQMWHVYTT